MKSAAALQRRSLFISAGHSAADPGAHGNGMSEADVVLDFRDRLRDCLSDKIVFDTDGQPGENLPLRTAAGMAGNHDIAVEFHCNAFARPGASGTETLSSAESAALGAKLSRAVSQRLGIVDRGAKSEASGQHSRLAFVSDGGGIILELFFITSPDDVQRYMSHLDECVEAVASVLIDAACERGS